jgi:protein-S-isoprenylcysteine O-methyltransferase Ste14
MTGMILLAWDLVRRLGGAEVVASLRPAGVISVVVGLALAVGGAVTLRANYSSTVLIREGHELVDRGLYRFVRHPIYLGALLVVLGLPLATSSWIALPPMLLLIPLILYRIRIEERLLLEEFGEEYRSYMRRTRRLVPLLY